MGKQQLVFKRLPLRALKIGNKGVNPMPSLEPVLAQYIRNYCKGQGGSEGLFTGLKWAPRTVIALTGFSLKNETVLRCVEGVPEASFFALINAHEHRERFNMLANRLEASVLSDGELLAMYLAWAQQMKFVLPHPLDVYRNAMIRDPLHGIRWALVMQDDTFAADLLAWAEENCRESAAAAWVTCVANSIDPEPFRPVFALNYMYACAIAVSTGMRFSLEDFPEDLPASSLFHLLANDALEDPHGGEVRLLQTDPLWGVEWLMDSNRSGDPSRLQLLMDAMRVWEKQSHPLQTNASRTISSLIDEFGDTGNRDLDADDEVEDDGESSDSEAEEHGRAAV